MMLNILTRRFSTAQKVYRPQYPLNFKNPSTFKIFDSTGCQNTPTFARMKAFHGLALCLCGYSIVQAYRKRRYIRGIFFWTPLMLVLATMATTSGFLRVRYVKQIMLRANGTHIDLKCALPWQSVKNVAISDIMVPERDELVQQLAENNQFLAKYSFYPLKVEKKVYAVEITGE